MADFPRTVTPISVTDLDIPGPMISTSQSGRVQLRSIQHSGWMWRETFLLNTRLTAHKGFLAQVRNLWRNGTSFDIAHVDYAALLGAGGGSPIIQASANIATNPENFGAWALGGTPVLTSGQSDPFGGTAAYLIEDDTAGAAEFISLPVTFTGNGIKSMAIYTKAGTSTQSLYHLFDGTAVADRLRVTINWSGGVPSPSASTGVAFVVEPVAAYPGWYRIPCQTASVTAANSNTIAWYPAGVTAGNTGTTYIFGSNAWNDVSPARYSGPSNLGDEPTGSVLYINGATASVSNWLRAGDPVSVTVGTTPRMLQATADVNTQANGYATIPINPPLYTGSAPIDNSAVITTTKIRACLIEPPQFPETSGQSADYGNLVLSFREVG